MAFEIHFDWATESALLAAILADPADDDPRLVLSDWMEEHGQQERAEFIRVQVELARRCCHQPGAKPGDYCNDSDCEHCHGRGEALRRRERDLLEAHGADWFRGDRGMPPGMVLERKAWMYRPLLGDHCPFLFWLGFASGFLGRFDGPAADWLRHADALTAAQPITSVTLTTRLRWSVGLDGFRLRDGAESRFFPGECPEGVPVMARDEYLRVLLAVAWQGIRFTLPAR